MTSSAQPQPSFPSSSANANVEPSTAVPQIQPVVLEARPGAPQATAVRIFLGTELAQYRAERVFFHSLEQVRNPDRRYEVYRMTGLPGFNQERWRTGFTNYRFAIPDLAGCQGKAIYTDVDQIFTADPAELFDQSMSKHGYLALSPEDTAVMLIDCERMVSCWNFDSASQKSKKTLLVQANSEPGRWGSLDPAWHARDMEYRHGESKLLHYTTLHLQPWRPTPEQYTYQIHPYAEYFLSLEQGADASGYEIYTATHPSPDFIPACQAQATPGDSGTALLPAEVAAFARMLGCTSSGLVGAWYKSAVTGLAVERWSFRQLPQTELTALDLIAATQLELLPPEDLPWIIDRLFALSRKMVFIQGSLTSNGAVTSTINGWRTLVRRIAQRYPERCWQLDCQGPDGQTQRFRADFPLRQKAGQTPKVWVLLGQNTGDNDQLVAIAKALGWPYEYRQSSFDPNKYKFIPDILLHKPLSKAAPGLEAPWPDLVLSAGYRSAPVAQWIKRCSGGKTRIVAIGRPRAMLSKFDLILTTPQYDLPLKENMIDMPAPYIEPRTLDENSLAIWQERFEKLPRPWVALLMGGSRAPNILDAETARQLGQQASAIIKAQGGSLLISTSPRSATEVTNALLSAIDVPHLAYRFEHSKISENPYPALLRLADAFIVTGESVSMLTEARMTDRPIALFPLPVFRRFKARLRHALEQRLGVVDRGVGIRGTPRQQNKLERFYYAGIAAGFNKRGRQVELVHTALGIGPLIEGLQQPSGVSPQLLASSRLRALEAVRSLITAEHSLR
ncbi:ELM1/GtrOC1 family putative glycosyltransferase [Azomonas macrocytogenes]|uniref:DUF1022 domain-containing protein n=1 Tax=Azomonas macrocytogenes TaxID=69962 RepID=A0A839T3F1_AZOMA|nr:ELM1/GtrOC1 family putative glycosyltransferase [Azomonas macrocytogenes]MBB3103210.1 hypothetical protein [Azomonas macrocytogenes]